MKNNITAQTLDAQIMSLSQAINQKPSAELWHQEMSAMPEWCGADLKVTSGSFYQEERSFFDSQLLAIHTRHAPQLTWLLLELKDAFSEQLDHLNKYKFYGNLGAAAQKHLAGEPETADHRPLLHAVLAVAYIAVPGFADKDGSDSTSSVPEQHRLGLTQWLQKDRNCGDKNTRN